jgi:hypothetical protein
MATLFNGDTIGNVKRRAYKHWQRKVWIDLPKKGLQLGMAPKVGRSSTHAMLEETGEQYMRPVAFNAERRVFVVRDPVARFKSLWKNKCRDGAKLSHGDSDAFLAGYTIDELLDLIESGQKPNHHWATQSELEGGYATELVPLEYYDFWLEDNGFTPPERKNVTSGDVDLTFSQHLRVMDLYHEDLDLYARAVSGYNGRISSNDAGGAS